MSGWNKNRLFYFFNIALLRFLTEDKIDHRVALTIAFRLQCLVDEYNNYELLSENDLSIKVRTG